MLLDNVVEEQQIEKVTWNVKDFVGMMTNDANGNIMRMFFDTLSELTVLDIDSVCSTNREVLKTKA